ncbi:MAG: nickel-responsive transcriptional regulator NikR [Proteobacteria bacterium]|nr:nickel-responsive transcriptional regulator NikR [Pseudomonadota bacterium]
MQRITVSIDEPLAERLDGFVAARSYQSRSEAMRDMVRDAVEAWRADHAEAAYSVANLSYVYDRDTRALAQRLSELRHAHHELVAAVTQVHLDHQHTLESVMLKGATADVRAFADLVRSQRGVRFGAVNLIAVSPHDHHDQPHAHRHSGQAHLSPVKG